MMSQDDLEQQVLLLASRDWNSRRTARDALVAAGAAGLSAAVEGLRHPDSPVRRGCVDFLDHHADDGCADDLRQVALHDPVPRVRRFAVHALGCVRCKTAPLDMDLVEFLAMVAPRCGGKPSTRSAISPRTLGRQPYCGLCSSRRPMANFERPRTAS